MTDADRLQAVVHLLGSLGHSPSPGEITDAIATVIDIEDQLAKLETKRLKEEHEERPHRVDEPHPRS